MCVSTLEYLCNQHNLLKDKYYNAFLKERKHLLLYSFFNNNGFFVESTCNFMGKS